jgi:hypothetical protein
MGLYTIRTALKVKTVLRSDEDLGALRVGRV